MSRYILNSAVITAPGIYEYKRVTTEEAKEWLKRPGWVSTVGYPETAAAMGAVFGEEIPTNRVQVKMKPGDEALVFRLVFPPGTPRLDAAEKGKLDVKFVIEHCEMGLLRMLV